MNSAILQIFWGLLIVFFDFRFNSFDILMDPVGYLIVAVGLSYFAQTYKPAKNGQALSFILLILAIPQIFIDTNAAPTMFGFWQFYLLAVSILSIVLAYFIFLLLIELAQTYNDLELKNKAENTMKAYLVIMISIMFLSTFSMNFNSLVVVFVILAIVGFITHIVFLVLIFKFRNLEDDSYEYDEHANNQEHTEG